MHPERDPLVRDQVSRLMGVLRQIAIKKNSPIRHHSRYDATLWLDGVEDHCTILSPEGPGDELLRVARVPRAPEPEAPREIRDWVRREPESDAVPEPTLRERGRHDGQETYLVEVPHVRATFDAWMVRWRPWAETERVRRPRQRIFESLFELNRLAADRPESVELVLASGLLHAPADLAVHLVAQPVRVEQDVETGEMVCVLSDDDGLRLEDDELLAGLPVYDGSGSAVLRERLLELAETPVAPGVATFLKEWAPRSLTVACTVDDSWTRPAGPQAQVAVAPAIVARRRGAFALRSYYDTMMRSLADPDRPVPLGLAQLVRTVEPDDRIAWLARAGAAPDLAADPLFPLPANEEQAAIITRLGVDTGVVVEGPPGTGKTHTIANLVSALLAQGQRVLVTSEKAQALRVLRDQLPAGMQDLCVSITDASPKGNSDLAKSVDTMAGHRTDFNPAHADRTIADLTARRGDTVRHRAELLEQIRILREAETVVHPEIASGFGGTLAAIARRLGDTAAEDGWVPGYTRGELPVSTDELRHLLGLLRDDTPQRRSRRGQRLPDPASLPSVDTVTGLVATVRAGAAVRAGAGGALVSVLEGLPANALVRLGPVCAEVGEAAAGLRMLPALSRWALESADTLLTGNGTHQWQRAVAQLTVVDAAIGHDQDADFADVHVAASVEVPAAAAAFERLAEHLAGGGAMRRLFKGTEQKDAERFGDEVLVDGSRPTTARAAAAAGHHLRFVEAAQRIDAAFRPVGMGFTLGAERAEGVGAMIGIRRACVAVDRLVATADSLRDLLSVLPPHRRPAPTRVPALEEIAARALDVAHARSAALAQAEIDTAAAALLAGVAPVDRPHETGALAQALAGGDPSAYADALALLDRARREQVDQECCDDLLARLHAIAPALADSIVADPGDSAWETRLPGWPRAWARACAASWIAEQVTPGREQRLDADLAVADAELRRLTGELAAERAWKACLQRMNAEQMQALQSYRNAVARVGKGTGKFAERFRRSARDAMVVAQSAVPAWVMPIQQVLASVPPEPNAFDVVIVDEASQADLTSAFLLWLAPRVIVVGDDKQCTPSEVASGALQPVFDRLDAELHDIPSYLRTVFTPKDSLFSVLRTRFGQVVRLREHFRCMPEIIEWSSTMFYPDAPLVPLRQFGADRLPPLRHTLVADAEVEGTAGRVVNPAEARAIAESVRACLGDPAYDRRTFGVVVLQSSPAQVELIDQKLRELIDPADWTERRLRIGTAPDFQGDERHVVWLSLVAAPNAPLRALTAEGFRQSYNVAVSRAQDQLWLFHSVTPEELRQTDLRHSLLSHVLSEGSTAIDPVLTDVVPDRRHPRFESLFEQRVFLDLVARGLHVTPQVESNRRAIDLVVTGAAGRLAVECDGEAFHTTPERRAADLDREQELVRCGWTFERVRESSYHLDRDAALAPVWGALDRLGIGPLTTPASPVEQPVAPRPTSRPRPAPAVRPEPAVELPAQAEVAPSPVLGPILPAELVDELLDRPASMPEPPPQDTRPTPQRDLPREDAIEIDTDPLPEEPAEVSDHQRRLILAAAGRSAPLTNESVRKLLKVPRDTALGVLQAMVAEGLLIRRGSYGGTHYVPRDSDGKVAGRSPQLAAEPAGRAAPVHREAVLRAALDRPLDVDAIRGLLGVDTRTAARVLAELAMEGLVERRSGGGGTEYALAGESYPSAQPAVRPIEPTPVQPDLGERPELDDREMLLAAAQQHHLTTTWAVEHLALGTAEARELLGTMVADGLLERSGHGRGTRYVLPGQPEPERPRFVIETRQRNRVLHAARRGQLTGESVRELLDVGADHATALLDALVTAGDLEHHSRGPGAYYALPAAAADRSPARPASVGHRPAAAAVMPQPAPTAEPGAAAEFESHMKNLYRRSADEVGFRDARFRRMLSEHGGLATAHQLLAMGTPSAGFTELWERRRLDLTVEALVLQPRFAALFRETERETARYRLAQHDFVPATDGL